MYICMFIYICMSTVYIYICGDYILANRFVVHTYGTAYLRWEGDVVCRPREGDCDSNRGKAMWSADGPTARNKR